MKLSRKYKFVIALVAMVVSYPSFGLEIEFQGQTVQTESISEQCLNIAGEYDGVRIENSIARKVARICQQSKQNDLLLLTHANFIATRDNVTVTVRFHNEFVPVTNGPTIGRVSLDGFFATAIGTEAPAGDTVELKGYLNQGSNVSLINEALTHTVGEPDDLLSAVFELQTEQDYLVAGKRTLKAELNFKLGKAGNQLVIKAIRVSLDPPWFKRPRTAE